MAIRGRYGAGEPAVIERPVVQSAAAMPEKAEGAQERKRIEGLLQNVDGTFIIDLKNQLLKVTDVQATPEIRINLGKLGAADTDYGIEIFDSSGVQIFSASGLGINTVGNAQIIDGAVTVDKMTVVTLSAITADLGTVTVGTLKANIIIEAEQIIAAKIGIGPDSSPLATATVSLVHDRTDSTDATLFVNAGQFTPGINDLRFQGLTSRPKLAVNSKTGTVFERMTVGSSSFTDMSGAGTLLEGYGLRIYDIITGGPSITTQWGLKIEDISVGVTKFAIQTGTGLVVFGDSVITSAQLVAGRTTLSANLLNGDILANNGVFAAGDAGVSNIDHIWHNDSANAWNFVSDGARKAAGNSQLRAGSLVLTGAATMGTLTATTGTFSSNVLVSFSGGNIKIKDSVGTNPFLRFEHSSANKGIIQMVGGRLEIQSEAANGLLGLYTESTLALEIDGAQNTRVLGELEIDGDLNHDGAKIGFFSKVPVTKQTVTGSKGGNGALASLLNVLENFYGIIVDSTGA